MCMPNTLGLLVLPAIGVRVATQFGLGTVSVQGVRQTCFVRPGKLPGAHLRGHKTRVCFILEETPRPLSQLLGLLGPLGLRRRARAPVAPRTGRRLLLLAP